MSTPSDNRAFSDGLVEESFDEAAFLWRRWEDELTSPTRSLAEVWSWTEDRLHGALDGVRVAADRLVDVVARGLRSDEPGRIAATAGLLGSVADPGATRALTTALETAEGPRLRALVRGIELLGTAPSSRAAAGVLAERSGMCAGELCRLKTFRRVAAGTELSAAYDSGIPVAMVNVMRAAACLPMPQAQEWIGAGLSHRDADVQFAAIESGLARGIEQAWRTAQQRAQHLGAHDGRCLTVLALLGTADDHEVVYSALRVPALQRHAVWALGHIGTVRAVDACVAGMQHEHVARACGEAYCWILGADLARDRLARPEETPDAPAFEDDDLEANLVPRPETLWPAPDPDAVRRHWSERRPDVTPDTRFVQGVAASTETMLTTIETGPMLRRPDLVLELRARTRGRYDVETRAFASRQRQMMADGRAALAGGVR